MRESESTLDRYKDKLDTHLKQGSSSKDPKHIDKIKVNKLQYEYQYNYLTFYYFLVFFFSNDLHWKRIHVVYHI